MNNTFTFLLVVDLTVIVRLVDARGNEGKKTMT